MFCFLYEGYQGFCNLLSFSDSDLGTVFCLYGLERREVRQRIHLGLLAVLIAVGNKGPYFKFTQNQFHLWLHQYQSDQETSSILFDQDLI